MWHCLGTPRCGICVFVHIMRLVHVWVHDSATACANRFCMLVMGYTYPVGEHEDVN